MSKPSFITRDKLVVLYYVFFAFILDILFFIVLDFGIFPKYFLFDFMFILLIATIIFIIPNFYVQCSVAVVFLIFELALCITNVIILKTAYEVFSFSMLGQAGDGLRAFDFTIMDMVGLTLFSILGLIIIGSFVFLVSKKVPKYKYTKRKIAIILAVFFSFQAIGVLGYSFQYMFLKDESKQNTFYVFESDKYLYDHHHFKTNAMKNFGIFGFYIQDINLLLSGNKLSVSETEDAARFFAGGVKEETPFSGVSKNNDLITVLLETFEYFAVDEIFTPNLYNLYYKDGILLNNFYANNRTNISEGLVLVGDYVKENPILSANQSALDTLNNGYYDLSLPKLLPKDYYSTFVHSYTSSFYNRNITHTKDYIGFDKLLTLEKMTRFEDFEEYGANGDAEFYKWYNWKLDSKLIDLYKEEIFPINKNYYTHFSTMITHGKHMKRDVLKPYFDTLTFDMYNVDKTLNENGNFYKVYQSLKKQGYTLPIQNDEMLYRFLWYKAAAMDMDKMIGNIFDYLRDTNRLNSTTIMLFSDHNAYYNDLTYFMKNIEKTPLNAGNVELYHIPTVIYDQKLNNALKVSKDLENLNISKSTLGTGFQINNFTSTFNLMPTIADLFNLNYNPNFCTGSSIFNSKSANEIFQSNIAGTPYFNNRIYMLYDTIIYKKDDVTNHEIKLFKNNALSLYKKNLYLEKLYQNPKKIFFEINKLVGV